MIGYKNTISGGSSIMQPIRIPENTRNVILVMNLISLQCYLCATGFQQKRNHFSGAVVNKSNEIVNKIFIFQVSHLSSAVQITPLDFLPRT